MAEVKLNAKTNSDKISAKKTTSSAGGGVKQTSAKVSDRKVTAKAVNSSTSKAKAGDVKSNDAKKSNDVAKSGADKKVTAKTKKAKSVKKEKVTVVREEDRETDKVKPVTAILSFFASFVFVGLMIFSVVMSSNAKLKEPPIPYYDVSYGVETFYQPSEIKQNEYDFSYKNTSLVGYSAEIIGTVTRNIPQETRDEGLKSGYPTYGKSLSSVLGGSNDKKKQRDDLIRESSYLCAKATTTNGPAGTYTKMDENGYLYNGNVPVFDKQGLHRRLYKHTAAVGMYNGNVSDEEQAVIKRITMRARGYSGYGVTGLYAPAGEIIKVQISEKDMNATGGITIHIGQALFNGQSNNIWTAKNQMQRMPVILNTMNVDKSTAVLENGVYTAYVGSYLGGPIYIRNEGVTFTATISGAVQYSHFILGYTSKEEFEATKKSSAPFFDLEVWQYGVLHSGPKRYAQNYSYDQLYKAAVLWEKVASVTTTGSNQGIVFMYDPFVAAGAAVAFPGRRSVNCPLGWMTSSLNYNAIVTSGSWGNFHEYHHNFQGYGVGNGGEVTNNALTLVSYSLFTKISSARGVGSFGAAGLSDWNCYTSATWALEQTLKIRRENENPSNGKQGLALYATLLHNFGQDNFIQTKVNQSGQNYLGYLKAWQKVTHYDMSYYFNDILQAGLSEEVLAENKNDSYPMFVPVSSVYQTGRSITYDGQKKYIKTMQPYVINYDEDFTVDLNKYTVEDGRYKSGSVVIPEGFSYTIKNISTDGAYGSFTQTGDKIYTYTPDKNHMESGKIIVTLGLTKDDGAFTVQDVDLVLEFQQTHDKKKTTLERTTYTYTADTVYASATEAYENNYEGYQAVTKGDNINKTQNCNTDIWYTNKNGDNMPQNSVVELKGKIYVNETAKYRLALRGRYNIALYVSLDGGENYELSSTYVQTSGAYTFPLTEGTYKDYQLEAGTWVYFKAVMVTTLPSANAKLSFIGLGWQKFNPAYSIYDEDGEIIETRPESISGMSYASAYRNNFEFTSTTFESDYFYTRKYNYNYVGETEVVTNGKTQTLIEELSNYVPWDTSMHNIQNLFDGKSDTGIHFSSAWGVSANKPAILTFDLGEEISANSMTLYTYLHTNSQKKGFPKTFTVEGSLNGTDFFEMGKWSSASQPAVKSTFTFYDNATYTFRYYRLKVTNTENGRVALNGLTFEHTFKLNGNGNNFFSPDNKMFTYAGDWKGTATQSSYGHVYVGKANATMSFEFTGTRLMLLSSNSFGKDFEVTIDGRKVGSIELKESNTAYGVSYLSEKLSQGKHNVTIKCLSEGNIDSVVFYNEA